MVPDCLGDITHNAMDMECCPSKTEKVNRQRVLLLIYLLSKAYDKLKSEKKNTVFNSLT